MQCDASLILDSAKIKAASRWHRAVEPGVGIVGRLAKPGDGAKRRGAECAEEERGENLHRLKPAPLVDRAARLFCGQGGLDSSGQNVVPEGGVMALAVDEECWSAVDAAADSAGEIGANFWQEFALFDRCAQVSRTKSESRS